ncbi:hypothetical protein LLH00_11070 [bacterium]|nr:hypothetical protein [bacterium]
MRVRDRFKKTGYFWLPSTPERKVPGTLNILDGGKIELEIVGFFEDGLENALRERKESFRIVGHIEEHGLVTLDNCDYKNKNIAFGGISKSLILVRTAFLGVAYDNNESISFNTFKFSVEGIDEWVGLSGINVLSNYKAKTAQIHFSPPEEIIINLNNNMQLLITFSWNLPGLSSLTEAKITQKTYFKLVSKKERPITDFISYAYKITTLLCFAIDNIVCIESITATSDKLQKQTNSGNALSVSVSIFYASLPYTESSPQIDKHQMLFRYLQIENTAEKIFNNWLAAYDEIDSAINLYFSVATNAHRYIDGKFLALAQGLETYHRRTTNEKEMDDEVFQNLTSKLISACPEEHQQWLSGRLIHGNEATLSRRIKSIIEPFKDYFGKSKERDNLIRNIVNTRNYLTHFDSSLKSKAASGVQLYSLYMKLEAIFQLQLLKMLDFSGDEIKSIFVNNNKLQYKLKDA